MTEISTVKDVLNIREICNNLSDKSDKILNAKVRHMEKKWIKYAAIFIIAGTVIGVYYPDKAFLTFVTAWLFVIPVMAAIYLTYGLIQYMRDRKNKIVVTIKNNDLTTRLMSIMREEEELKKAKEAIYKQMKNEENKGL